MYQSSLTDNELLARYRTAGDSLSMACLYKRYAPLVFGLCFKHLQREADAKDAVSDIFLIVLRKARSHPIYSFRHWIYTISRNYLYSCSRQRLTRAAEPVQNFSRNIMEKEPSDTLYTEDHKLVRLEAAWQKLDEAQQTCVQMFFIEEKSYREIANATGLDMGRVKSSIQNGKRKLKHYYGPKYPDHEP